MMFWIAFLFVGGLSGGQEQIGSLTGTVQDPSGAPVPGVTIEICREPTIATVGSRFFCKK